MRLLSLCLSSCLWFGLSSSPDSCHGSTNEKDKVWCEVTMPRESHFGFSPPDDPKLWAKAQAIAASGEPILAKHIQELFTHPYDFIDGDKSFKNIENLVDYFLDPKTMFSPISNGVISEGYKKIYAGFVRKFGKEDEKYFRQGYENLRYTDRAPIVQIGYFRYSATGERVTVRGNSVRSPNRQQFLDEFLEIESAIVYPSIFVCTLNENWGWISSAFPNRTQQWGRYPKNPLQRNQMMRFLNSEKVVMLVVNQHLNISHPKLLVLPRGIPPGTNEIMWDALRHLVKKETKSALLVSYSSSWGPRPQILRCVSEKFDPSDFIGHTDGGLITKEFGSHLVANSKTENRTAYYIKLGMGRFGLMLPGLGYDCFRNWEMLALGTVGIMERGVGFDRMFWRLPVLLVDDFYEVTPELLRVAYVEAVYRTLRKEFEFERLRQSYWYSVIFTVSVQRDASHMIEKFPMRAEKKGFVRPFRPFSCGEHGELCGDHSIRTPKQSC